MPSRELTIAVDARELVGRPTGVGRYLAGLLSRWWDPDRSPRHRWLLVAPQAPLLEGLTPPEGSRIEIVPGGAGTLWEQLRLRSAWAGRPRPDVLFAPAYTAPLFTAVPRVVTIHDLSYFHRPAWFGTREGARRRWLTRAAAGRARLVLTDSEFSRDEIRRWLGVPADRIRVIPLGLGRNLAMPPPPEREPIVLFVGSIFQRRHVPTLVTAFAGVAADHPEVRLEIVGENRSHPAVDPMALARRAGVGDRVRVRSWVPEGILEDLFSRARAFAFLSEYEGFGLPPLEALAAGVPAVVGDTPTAREIYGEAVLYVAPGDAAAAGAALERLLFDESLRRELLARAADLLPRYRWERSAAATLSALEEAALPMASRKPAG